MVSRDTQLEPLRILVTDGEQRAALACVRSLGRGGHHVEVAAIAAGSLAAASRFARGEHALGDPAQDPSGWLERLTAAARSEQIDWILPLSEVALGTLYAFGRSESLRVVCPARGSYDAATDKHALLARAESLGVPVPRGVLVEDLDELTELPAGFDFPVVLKPRRSRWLHDGVWRAGDAAIVRSAEEIRQLAAATQPGEAFLLQEFVDGHGEAVFLLAERGEPKVAFAHRRLREKPPTGGVSVLREAIAPDPQLLRWSEDLLRDLAYDGAAMIEFRRTPGGQAVLMEINPRLWGSLQLAIDAGVDFPSLCVDLAAGRPPEEATARIGVRTRWLLGDVDHLAIALRRPAVRSHLGIGRMKVVGRFLRSFVDGTRLEVLDRRDPRPFAREFSHWLRGSSG